MDGIEDSPADPVKNSHWLHAIQFVKKLEARIVSVRPSRRQKQKWGLRRLSEKPKGDWGIT